MKPKTMNKAHNPPPDPRRCCVCGTLTRHRVGLLPGPTHAARQVAALGFALAYDVPVCIDHDPTGPEVFAATAVLLDADPIPLRPDAPDVFRHWLEENGRPRAAVPRMGGFDGWAQTVGSVLAHAGVDEFLANLEQVVQVRDDETQQWARFFDAWWYEFGSEWVATDDVYQRILMARDGVHDGAIPDAILVQRDRGPGAARRSLGRNLARLAGRVYGGRKLIVSTHSHRKTRMWRLQPLDGTQATQRTQQESDSLW